MASVDVVDATGKKIGEHELDPAVFDVQVNVPVMHQIVVASQAARRAGTHSTKTRSEVSGGGTKPWRQKGTGRARHGSNRSPIWTGGGVAHGPRPLDHSLRVNKKERRLALRSALTDRAREGRIRVVESLGIEEPKTADAAGLIDSVGLGGRVLVVLGRPDEAAEKSFRNLSYVQTCYPGNISTYEVLYADWILFTREAIEAVKP